MLEEYNILKEVLYITSVENVSHVQVKIIFNRRIDYHLFHTFLQVIEKLHKKKDIFEIFRMND